MRDDERIAVIGAGIAGLACAAELGRAGCAVTLFDKGRRPGGRVATKRVDLPGHGSVSFDHGAQYVTARGAGLVAALAAMQQAGAVAPWPAAAAASRSANVHWAGMPGMSSLPRHLAGALPAGVAPAMSRHAAYLRRTGAGWILRHLPAEQARPGQVVDDGESAGPFAAVLLAMPAPQAAALLQPTGHRFAADAERASLAPCWAAMAVFADRLLSADVLRPASGSIAWAAREASRPGRRQEGPDCWVIHATQGWSWANLERTPTEAASLLLAEFAGLAGALRSPVHEAAHRWRHALVERSLGRACLWDPQAGLGLCGDWCLGARVEAAFDSGQALARAAIAVGVRGTAPAA